TPGSYTLTATYSPVAGSIHAGSSGSDIVQVITRTTSATLDCPASTPANSPTTCTVTVTDTASGTKSAPLGTVGFTISGGPAGAGATVTPNPCALTPSSPSSSSCIVSFSANMAGSYAITATYSPAGNSIHSGSSGTDTVTVTKRSTATT